MHNDITSEECEKDYLSSLETQLGEWLSEEDEAAFHYLNSVKSDK